MTDTWHGRPEASSNRHGEEFRHDPAGYARTGSYSPPPRHGAPLPRQRTGPPQGPGPSRADAHRRPPRDAAAGGSRRADASAWHWLLLVPIVLPLIPGLYNRMEPTLFGLPFFYWSQLGFAFLASAVITVVHLKVR